MILRRICGATRARARAFPTWVRVPVLVVRRRDHLVAHARRRVRARVARVVLGEAAAEVLDRLGHAAHAVDEDLVHRAEPREAAARDGQLGAADARAVARLHVVDDELDRVVHAAARQVARGAEPFDLEGGGERARGLSFIPDARVSPPRARRRFRTSSSTGNVPAVAAAGSSAHVAAVRLTAPRRTARRRCRRAPCRARRRAARPRRRTRRAPAGARHGASVGVASGAYSNARPSPPRGATHAAAAARRSRRSRRRPPPVRHAVVAHEASTSASDDMLRRSANARRARRRGPSTCTGRRAGRRRGSARPWRARALGTAQRERSARASLRRIVRRGPERDGARPARPRPPKHAPLTSRTPRCV